MRSDLFVLAAPFCGLLAPALTIWFLLRHATVSIDPQKAIVKHPASTAVDIPWRAVTILEEDSESIIIGAKLPRLQAPYYAIPKRVFATAAKAQAFLDQARAYWREAVGEEPNPEQTAWPPAPKQPA
jgi:hypothetical protein